MLRRLSFFVFIVAVLIAIGPLLHSHPLQQNGIPEACAICATGIGPLPVIAPSVAAPQVVAYILAPFTIDVHTVSVVLSLPSRAPPAL